MKRERLDHLGRRRRRCGFRGNQRECDVWRGRTWEGDWQSPNDVSRDGLGPVLDGEKLGLLLRLALGPKEHLGMVLVGQHVSQLDQRANRQPACCEGIRDRSIAIH
jgi:hypothetical protein